MRMPPVSTYSLDLRARLGLALAASAVAWGAVAWAMGWIG
jgi:hypothetical protein